MPSSPLLEPAASVVALGASAGGLEALTAFFDTVPVDCGVAFIVVTHQRPDAPTLLPELLARHTPMDVINAADGQVLQPGRVYLGPPGELLAVQGGAVYHRGPPDHGAPALLVDAVFRSLADDLGDRAIGVVLSGTGSDGTLGVAAIKGAGGLCVAQLPDSAAHDGMPTSAIASGHVDITAAPREIWARLEDYLRRSTGPAFSDPSSIDLEEHAEALNDILAAMRQRTGRDFSLYKDGTVRRRIARRMAMHELDSPAGYLALVRRDPGELDLMFSEMLIGVTSFFRTPSAYAALATHARTQLESLADGAQYRVWVAGCSTGEEAYSIAIVLAEIVAELSVRVSLQIFATDLDETAIERARTGLYGAGIAADVAPARLERHFRPVEGGYQVREEIREVVVFAPQSLIADPPFTRIDLITCRNVLIYLKPELQDHLIPMFHYALSPGGLLLLGTSESVGAHVELFSTLDKAARLYRARDTHRLRKLRMPAGQALTRWSRAATQLARRPNPRPATLSALVERLLIDRYVPPSVLVTPQGELVHIHGHTGHLLEPSPGEPTHNLLAMSRPGLRTAVATALRRAVRQGGAPSSFQRVTVEASGEHVTIDVTAKALSQPEPLAGLVLVTFETRPEASTPRASSTISADGDGDADIAALMDELRETRETLRATVDDYETTNEEMYATNEEFASTNEELQSANEELETSKEELQSLYEELQAVNTELRSKVDDLSQIHDDMRNLLNSTHIATLFLDADLRIVRFTERAQDVVHLIPGDVGRPISDLVSRLDYEGLVTNARQVLSTLVPIEAEAQSRDGAWYLVRILPYRTTRDAVVGLVVTFVDIDATKRAEALSQAIVRTTREPWLVLDHQLRVVTANPSYCDAFEVDLESVTGQELGVLWGTDDLDALRDDNLALSGAQGHVEIAAQLPTLGPRRLVATAIRLVTRAGSGEPQLLLSVRIMNPKEA